MKFRPFFLVVAVLSGINFAFGQSGGPKLVITKTEFNAGEIKEGTPVKHTFTFRNEGTASLEIKKVTLTCGCETVDYDKAVAPGQEGKLTLLVKTEGASGAQSKLVVVTTNDPQKPSFDLSIQFNVLNTGKKTGQVVGAFVVAPSTQVGRQSPVGTAPDYAVTIYSTGAPPAKVTKVVSDVPGYTFSLEPGTDGATWVIRATGPQGLPVGRHRHSATALTDSKETPEIKLEFDTTVVLPLRVSPQQLAFTGVVSVDGAPPRVSKFIWVMQAGGPVFEFKGFESTLPFLSVERSDSGNATGGATILRVVFTANPPKGTHTGKLVIKTNQVSQPQFEIQVTVNAQ